MPYCYILIRKNNYLLLLTGILLNEPSKNSNQIFHNLKPWKYIITRIPKGKNGHIISGSFLCYSLLCSVVSWQRTNVNIISSISGRSNTCKACWKTCKHTQYPSTGFMEEH